MLGTTLILAFREIQRHLLRSFLTTLGIVIGVAAVITMVTLGNGATAAVKKQISSLGSNILSVRPGQRMGPGSEGEAPPPFKNEDLDAIRDQIAGVRAVAGQAQTTATAVRNAQNWSTTVNGTTNDFLEAQQWMLASGRRFTDAEEQAGKSVCIIGNTVRANLFQGVDPIGQRLRVKDVSCTVIGLLATRGQGGFGNDQDDTIIMPLKMVQRRFTGNRDLRSIMVAVDDDYDTTVVQSALTSLLRERRHLTDDQPDNFSIFDTRQISEAISGSTKIMTGLLGAVAAVSLVVGGIGIMNIMLVSVTERTREIGLRMAVGARGRDILGQFLVEAVTLALIGGLIGIAMGLGGAEALSAYFEFRTLVAPSAIAVAFGFAAAVGVGFGFFPALKASWLDPIDALRYE